MDNKYEITVDMGFRVVIETYETKEEAESRYKGLIELTKKPYMSGLRITKDYE